MLTVICCVLVVIITCLCLWKTKDSFLAGMGWFTVIMSILFSMIFPILYGYHMAQYSNQSSITKVYDVSEINGKYYYLNDSEWVDILSVPRIMQSNRLSVTSRKAPFSYWYWQMSYMEAKIPITEIKGEK